MNFNEQIPSGMAIGLKVSAVQAIFSRSRKHGKRKYGYELLYRGHRKPLEEISGTEMSLLTLFDLYTAPVGLDKESLPHSERLIPGHFPFRLFVNTTEQMLLDRTPELLHPDDVVIEILETVMPTPDILDRVRELKTQGYTLALDDYFAHDVLDPFLPHMDIIKVDLAVIDSAQFRAMRTQDHQHDVSPLLEGLTKRTRELTDAELLAEKVETAEQLKHCYELGYDYFQGFYLSRPNRGILVRRPTCKMPGDTYG